MENSLNNTVFILGGGPSLKEFWNELEPLADKLNIFCVNNSYKLAPNSELMLFGDFCWFEWNYKHLLENYKGKIFSSIYFNTPYEHRINFIRIDDKNGGLWTKDNTRINGNNSGHQAINLAYNFGYKKVVLVGFDMDRNSTQTHWHNEHRRPTNTKLYTETMIPGMKRIAEQIKIDKLDFAVYNLNKNSAIDCFEFCELKDIL